MEQVSHPKKDEPRLYVHEGKGHYIGSVVVVIAHSESEGWQLIRDYLDSNGLSEPVNMTKTVNLTSIHSELIYAQNGDY
ncbi:hypothetical protein IC229_33200 [Spirosoma sp. BT702]|uniref:Uncharacterized protein n=1 Tax=Spirosoma profusum TaxID=2771354 RepID=A0A927GAF4_9BACT|nr:hypothetical protein [Spirosoma profusum]MBD2705516.1 hypothetical protein [Spirosoma profusum]